MCSRLVSGAPQAQVRLRNAQVFFKKEAVQARRTAKQLAAEACACATGQTQPPEGAQKAVLQEPADLERSKVALQVHIAHCGEQLAS